MTIQTSGAEEAQTSEPTTPSVTSEPTEGADPSASSEDSGDAGQGGAVVPPPYQPNLTFRMRDPSSHRQVEKKFDDWIHGVVKDPETEKKVRELHERAYGLDAVKSDRERISGELQQTKQQIQQQYQPVMETVQQVAHFRDQGNFDAVFKLIGIPQQEVFKWAYQFATSSPEARAQLEKNASAGMEAYGAQHQMSRAQQDSIQQATDFKQRELGLLMRYDTQVSGAAADFDDHHGNGAFIEQIKRTGDYYWRMGQDISVEQAAREVLKLIGKATPAMPQGQAHAQVPGQGLQHGAPMQGAPLQAPTRKPVIPSLQGTGTSPVKRVYSSMEDIRKRRKELEAAGE